MDRISVVITDTRREAENLFYEAASEHGVGIEATNAHGLFVQYSNGNVLRFISKSALPQALLGMNVVQVMNLVRTSDYYEINDFAQSRVRG